MSVSIQIEGLDRAIAKIDAMARLATHKQPILAVMAETVRAQTIRRINETKTDPAGVAWKPLAAATVKRKGTSNILVDTGRLMGSISSSVFANHAEVGTNVKYAKYHHTGSQKVANRPPKRQFLGVSNADKAELERVVTAVIGALVR